MIVEVFVARGHREEPLSDPAPVAHAPQRPDRGGPADTP